MKVAWAVSASSIALEVLPTYMIPGSILTTNSSLEILKSFLIIDRTPEGSPERTMPSEIVPIPPCKPLFFLPVPAIFRRFTSKFSSNSDEFGLDQTQVSEPSIPEQSIAGPSTSPHSDNAHQKVKLEDFTVSPTKPTNPNSRTYSLRPKRAKREAEDNEEEKLSSPQKRARARKGKAKVELV
ncbi:hypothetical protein OCU04_005699 [Sclerotinia nivalis]|uniref:Uncharacterized protein n=1 Tax=Sclerotinia nivalis TaxID=352851 RepID=A0A9X0APP6_9HELO|nr:hypothetical protein OCU04_005699 [Sclerotinia nivalis]